MNSKWVIFDVMGVIFEVGDDINDLLVPYLQRRKPGLTRELINEVYLKASRGEFNSFCFWENLGFGQEYPAIELDYLNNCLTLDPHFQEVAEVLKQDYNLALLSNDLAEWSKYLRVRHNLEHFFQSAIISGAVGYRKPEKEIYRILLEKIKVPATDCIFIDDRIKNLITAAELGFNTVWLNREKEEIIRPEINATIIDLRELPAIVGKRKNTAGLLIRELEREELVQGVRVIQDSFATVAREFGLTEDNCPTHPAFIQIAKLLEAKERGIKFFGLFSAKSQIGLVAVEKSNAQDFFLERLSVLPEHRHQGYGKMLIDFVFDYVREQGGKTIKIALIDEHAVLKKWYQDYGFKETGAKKFPHLPFTVCFMEKEI